MFIYNIPLIAFGYRYVLLPAVFELQHKHIDNVILKVLFRKISILSKYVKQT